jgi:hypothetical protein
MPSCGFRGTHRRRRHGAGRGTRGRAGTAMKAGRGARARRSARPFRRRSRQARRRRPWQGWRRSGPWAPIDGFRGQCTSRHHLRAKRSSAVGGAAWWCSCGRLGSGGVWARKDKVGMRRMGATRLHAGKNDKMGFGWALYGLDLPVCGIWDFWCLSREEDRSGRV